MYVVNGFKRQGWPVDTDMVYCGADLMVIVPKHGPEHWYFIENVNIDTGGKHVVGIYF